MDDGWADTSKATPLDDLRAMQAKIKAASVGWLPEPMDAEQFFFLRRQCAIVGRAAKEAGFSSIEEYLKVRHGIEGEDRIREYVASIDPFPIIAPDGTAPRPPATADPG